MKRNGKLRLAALTAAAFMLLPGMTVCADGTYTTKAGDNLSKIAKAAYGDEKKWKDIYESNKAQIKDPNVLFANQVLTLPGEAAVTAQETAADAQAVTDAQTAAEAQAAADTQAAAQAQQQISAAEEINAYQGEYEASWEGTYENKPAKFQLEVDVFDANSSEPNCEAIPEKDSNVYYYIYNRVEVDYRIDEIEPEPESPAPTISSGSGIYSIGGGFSIKEPLANGWISPSYASADPEGLISLGGGSFQILAPWGGAATLTFAPDGSGVSVSANFANGLAVEDFAARVAE